MTQDDIDPFTVEEICEEKFNRFTVVIHGALSQNLVHRLENKVLILDLLQHPIIKSIELECMGKSVQEDFVRDGCGPLIIFLVLDFIIFAYNKLVQENQDQNSTTLPHILAEGQNHYVVQLAQIELGSQFLNHFTVLWNIIYNMYSSVVNELRQNTWIFHFRIYQLAIFLAYVQVGTDLSEQHGSFNTHHIF